MSTRLLLLSSSATTSPGFCHYSNQTQLVSPRFSGGEKEIGGSMKEKKEEVTEKSVAAVSWTVVVLMILGSLMGGLLLGWWEWKFHSDYEQLWMVPFGLILLVTPIIAFSSVFISGVCCFPAAAVHSLDDDPET